MTIAWPVVAVARDAPPDGPVELSCRSRREGTRYWSSRMLALHNNGQLNSTTAGRFAYWGRASSFEAVASR